MNQIERECKVKIDRTKNVRRQLLFLEEKLYSMYSGENATEIAFMPVWTIKRKGNRFKKEYYKHSIEMDFENIKIAVPAMYDAVLRSKYGDYMQLVHNWEFHEYPYYKKQMDFMEKAINVKYPEYSFKKSDLSKNRQEKVTIKTQLVEFISLLDEAHGAIEEAWRAMNISILPELLEACQNGAIAMGNMIEESQGEGAATVGILEQYCEVVFRTYKALMAENLEGAVEISRALAKMLSRISDSVEQDIKLRKEIVFLPYKASLWDGFESVFRAAVEDENCDVYVVPIPYFYRDAVGTFREMQYEGEQFPADVPVIWHEDYDFVSRQPDMIFIQNPYDEYNPVISVLPNYYARILKNYTEKLVYIPSFIMDEVDPRDGRAMTNTHSYITVPGVVQSDRVIVQSESMRQTYIEVLTKFAGEDTRTIWEEKILGLGSPKNDKKNIEARGQLSIPQEWSRILQKANKSYKKVILYHTSSSMIVQEPDKYLEKLQSVLRTFKENQDEVVLLWKPHPQTKETIESVYPQLWKEYQQIVKAYQTEGVGIYDDMADDERAVALCDAYYGDNGNLAQKCRMAGKPVMIQAVDIC